MKRFRLTASLLTVSAFSLQLAMPAAAFESEFSSLPDLSAYESRVMIDGAFLSDGPQPLLTDEGALLPLRSVLESSGCSIAWNAAKNNVEIRTSDDQQYELDLKKGTLSQENTVSFTDDALCVRQGNTFVSPELIDSMDGFSAHWDRSSNTAIISTPQPSDNLYLYDLGEGSLKNPGREDTIYQMQGIVGVPEGTDRPVAVILHGAHPIDKAAENRYDLGFAYLVDALADAGYLALSINVGMNYSFEDGEPSGCSRTLQIVEQHIAALSQAIEGKDAGFPCSLTGKGDLDRVLLIGHSRGGMDVFSVAAQEKGFHTAGILSLAPAQISPFEGSLPDVPAAILIPQYDGDVSQLDGARIYEDLLADPARTAPAELVYLKSGNHGGFSTALRRPDPFASIDQLPLVMDSKTQQAFTIQYTLDFAQALFTTKEGTPHANTLTLPDTYAGCSVLLRVDQADQSLFFAQTAAENEQLPAAKNGEARFVLSSSTLDNTAGAFRLPGGMTDCDLLRLSWKKPEAAFSFPIPKTDLSKNSTLRLEIAQDSTDPAGGQQDQGLTVTVSDARGQSASVHLPAGTPALTWQEGTIKEITNFDGSVFSYYSTFTPLSSLRIDLSQLKGVDLSCITQLTLTPDTESGSLMLRAILAESVASGEG